MNGIYGNGKRPIDAVATSRRSVISITEWHKAQAERRENLERAAQHFRAGEYDQAAWRYIAGGERKKAVECAEALCYRRDFTYAEEVYEKLGMREQLADTLYEAGNCYKATLIYLELYIEERDVLLTSPLSLREGKYDKKALDCARKAEVLGSAGEAQEIRGLVENARKKKLEMGIDTYAAMLVAYGATLGPPGSEDLVKAYGLEDELHPAHLIGN